MYNCCRTVFGSSAKSAIGGASGESWSGILTDCDVWSILSIICDNSLDSDSDDEESDESSGTAIISGFMVPSFIGSIVGLFGGSFHMLSGKEYGSIS